jgi:transcriptional regulator with XRE-family HTH domain
LAAEQAMTAYEQNLPTVPPFPPVAQRILRARQGRGLSQDEVAVRWGEPVSMYWDLELFDDEAFTVISLLQLQRLASVLETSVCALLLGEDPGFQGAAVSYTDVIGRLRSRIAEEPTTVEHLSAVVGWHLQPLFDAPETLGDMPVCGIFSVCQAADVEWITICGSAQGGRSAARDVDSR